MCQLFFDEESIYEISKLSIINFEQTHGQAQSNMQLQLFKSWGGGGGDNNKILAR